MKLLLYASVVVTATVVVSSVLIETSKILYKIPMNSKWVKIQIFNSIKILFVYLQNCKILQDAVFHVSFWQVFEFEDKVNHIFTHWGSEELVNESSTFKSCIFCLNFFHNLLSKTANLSWTLNGHILRAFIPKITEIF